MYKSISKFMCIFTDTKLSWSKSKNLLHWSIIKSQLNYPLAWKFSSRQPRQSNNSTSNFACSNVLMNRSDHFGLDLGLLDPNVDFFVCLFFEVFAQLDVRQCPKLHSCSISRKTNDANLRKWRKVPGPVLDPQSFFMSFTFYLYKLDTVPSYHPIQFK